MAENQFTSLVQNKPIQINTFSDILLRIKDKNVQNETFLALVESLLFYDQIKIRIELPEDLTSVLEWFADADLGSQFLEMVRSAEMRFEIKTRKLGPDRDELLREWQDRFDQQSLGQGKQANSGKQSELASAFSQRLAGSLDFLPPSNSFFESLDEGDLKAHLQKQGGVQRKTHNASVVRTISPLMYEYGYPSYSKVDYVREFVDDHLKKRLTDTPEYSQRIVVIRSVIDAFIGNRETYEEMVSGLYFLQVIDHVVTAKDTSSSCYLSRPARIIIEKEIPRIGSDGGCENLATKVERQFHFPNIRTAVRQLDLDLRKTMKLRNSRIGGEFRSWFSSRARSDEGIAEEYRRLVLSYYAQDKSVPKDSLALLMSILGGGASAMLDLPPFMIKPMEKYLVRLATKKKKSNVPFLFALKLQSEIDR